MYIQTVKITVSKNAKQDNPSHIYTVELGIKSNTHKQQNKHDH